MLHHEESPGEPKYNLATPNFLDTPPALNNDDLVSITTIATACFQQILFFVEFNTSTVTLFNNNQLLTPYCHKKLLK